MVSRLSLSYFILFFLFCSGFYGDDLSALTGSDWQQNRLLFWIYLIIYLEWINNFSGNTKPLLYMSDVCVCKWQFTLLTKVKHCTKPSYNKSDDLWPRPVHLDAEKNMLNVECFFSLSCFSERKTLELSDQIIGYNSEHVILPMSLIIINFFKSSKFTDQFSRSTITIKKVNDLHLRITGVSNSNSPSTRSDVAVISQFSLMDKRQDRF